MAGLSQSRHERGYGYDHVKTRAGLLHVHVDGTPCYWCGLPMHKAPTANWDGSPLAADHSERRARDGGKADRLLHGRCNSQRQDGSRDDERPAVTGVTPWEWAGTAPPATAAEPASDESYMDLGTTFFDWPDLV
ncbi:hypothetical protein [Rhodococcus sp. IEGM 1330]|uniref:hypothetical protein n=1 Tax=Rhodococcus sp. IEGM 1330 TaxID=3082225 RepID=UPI00295555FE|nr:hypothetical protein [Rhodococcus sp. IEGM 1330]MDV8023995.1 hypothetical protein [Rhodococcus sp. IEGM 1330]